jgi:hypothetical protein
VAEQIKLLTNNILESGTLTVTDADADFPKERLHDRCLDLWFKYTGFEASFVFHIDQGATGNLSHNMLAVPRHIFSTGSSLDFYWQGSADNVAWSNLVASWTVDDSTPFYKEQAIASTYRYLRMYGVNLTNPACGEIFMGLAQDYDVLAEPAPSLGRLDNVVWRTTTGGIERPTKQGPARNVYKYGLGLDETDRATLRTQLADLDGYSKPFILIDHLGEMHLVRLTAPPDEVFTNYRNSAGEYYTRTDIEMVEML